MSIIMPHEDNKANWQPLPNKFYEIGVGDIQRYLEDEVLGFKIACSWERWTGISAFVGYLVMKVVFNPKDIEIEDRATDYVSTILRKTSAERQLNKSVMDALEPFMYPQNMNQIYMEQNREKLRHMNELGIVGSKLDELVRWSKINRAVEPNTGRPYYRVYLRPERIVMAGLQDATTHSLEGSCFIRRIYGTRPEQFRLLVERVMTNNSVTDELSVEQIFALR